MKVEVVIPDFASGDAQSFHVTTNLRIMTLALVVRLVCSTGYKALLSTKLVLVDEREHCHGMVGVDPMGRIYFLRHSLILTERQRPKKNENPAPLGAGFRTF